MTLSAPLAGVHQLFFSVFLRAPDQHTESGSHGAFRCFLTRRSSVTFFAKTGALEMWNCNLDSFNWNFSDRHRTRTVSAHWASISMTRSQEAVHFTLFRTLLWTKGTCSANGERLTQRMPDSLVYPDNAMWFHHIWGLRLPGCILPTSFYFFYLWWSWDWEAAGKAVEFLFFTWWPMGLWTICTSPMTSDQLQPIAAISK